ncbi:MAG: hypothetical protein IPI45_12280 [Saprospiraceae bacterium]|nr:hypothetical protein [Saprospiraceae bacterium]MBK7738542.1 hypothetical protein [Saprospiraceae bacterium]MBK7912886.1 hypothetical protein [Saprospiraceae bacterium]
MKLNLIRGALFAAMFGLLIGCDKIKNVSCGDATEYITDLESHYLTSIPGNGRTTLIYENTNEDPSDICSLAHLDASFFAKFTSPLPEDAIVSGFIYWSGLLEKEVILQKQGDGSYSGQLNIGLKQAFNGKPASVGAQIRISFNSNRSHEENLQFITSKDPKLSIQFEYYSTDEERPGCGKFITNDFHINLLDSNSINQDSLFNFEYFKGNAQEFSQIEISKDIMHVCISDSIRCTVWALDPLPSELELTTYISWANTHTKLIPLLKSNDTQNRSWTGKTSLLLYPTYTGYEIGDFKISTNVGFPYQGSIQLDSAYLKKYFLSLLSIQVQYSDYYK